MPSFASIAHQAWDAVKSVTTSQDREFFFKAAEGHATTLSNHPWYSKLPAGLQDSLRHFRHWAATMAAEESKTTKNVSVPPEPQVTSSTAATATAAAEERPKPPRNRRRRRPRRPNTSKEINNE